ncbi:MAG TPA: CotH kinase family protein [Tepidisphaeraceae bacterium]|nr:CotH kinase family protein [Tepidisphaeraceae bacterium]
MSRVLACPAVVLVLLAAPMALAAEKKPADPAKAVWEPAVSHAPREPRAGEAVTITVNVGLTPVTGVTLEYQVVDPGAYVELKSPEFAKGWTAVPMAAGGGGAGKTFSAVIPAGVQKHRRLVRYRLVGAGASSLMAPAREGECPNYAYFVYDGVPAWSGAVEPKSGDAKRKEVVTFPTEVMRSVQAYHLIARHKAVENVTWKEQTGGKEFKYTGTLVAGGVVYDHVKFRARGGVWRYAMGKNMWKIDFPDGHRLRAVDDFGKPHGATWGKLNLRPGISMASYGRRGEQGMYESVGHRLFNLAGVPSPETHWVQWRIVSEADEAPAGDQYKGDFWGLYLAIENVDGRFLKAHDLPDGNLYKMANGTGELNNEGKGQPTDKSDLNGFLNAYNSKDQSDVWWRASVDLPRYYSYRAIVEAIHHYDIGEGKNYNYFREPTPGGRWQVIPWDLDLTWADHMYGNGEEPFKSRVLSKPALKVEYQNRLREIRDLLYNPEQTGRLIDQYAAVVADPVGKLPLVEADRRKWDYHPAMAVGGQAGQGLFYQASPTRDFAGMVKQMKEYVAARLAWIDRDLLKDKEIPETPTATYAGPAGYPVNQLKFRAGPYKGKAAMAGVRWRVAEVTAPPAREGGKTAGTGAYEINAVWQSADAAHVRADVSIPAGVLVTGKTYRVRVMARDVTNRQSHWSAPVEFVAGVAK